MLLFSVTSIFSKNNKERKAMEPGLDMGWSRANDCLICPACSVCVQEGCLARPIVHDSFLTSRHSSGSIVLSLTKSLRSVLTWVCGLICCSTIRAWCLGWGPKRQEVVLRNEWESNSGSNNDQNLIKTSTDWVYYVLGNQQSYELGSVILPILLMWNTDNWTKGSWQWQLECKSR